MSFIDIDGVIYPVDQIKKIEPVRFATLDNENGCKILFKGYDNEDRLGVQGVEILDNSACNLLRKFLMTRVLVLKRGETAQREMYVRKQLETKIGSNLPFSKPD